MVNEPEPSTAVVEAVTWTLYLGWLSAVSMVGLWIGVEPLTSVRESFEEPWQGTAAALAVGVAILIAVKAVFDVVKGRWSNVDGAEDAPVDAEGAPASPSQPKSAKKKRKKNKKTKRGHR